MNYNKNIKKQELRKINKIDALNVERTNTKDVREKKKIITFFGKKKEKIPGIHQKTENP